VVRRHEDLGSAGLGHPGPAVGQHAGRHLGGRPGQVRVAEVARRAVRADHQVPPGGRDEGDRLVRQDRPEHVGEGRVAGRLHQDVDRATAGEGVNDDLSDGLIRH
jgi:hypothetical protein